MCLLVGMIGRAHHGSAGDVGKAQCISQFRQPVEFIRVDVTVHR